MLALLTGLLQVQTPTTETNQVSGGGVIDELSIVAIISVSRVVAFITATAEYLSNLLAQRTILNRAKEAIKIEDNSDAKTHIAKWSSLYDEWDKLQWKAYITYAGAGLAALISYRLDALWVLVPVNLMYLYMRIYLWETILKDMAFIDNQLHGGGGEGKE